MYHFGRINKGFARFVNVKDEHRATSLHLAARRRRPDCVHTLLDNGSLICASTSIYGKHSTSFGSSWWELGFCPRVAGMGHKSSPKRLIRETSLSSGIEIRAWCMCSTAESLVAKAFGLTLAFEVHQRT
ncbi:hypothetical protein ACLOJK_024077 [Asimina triloba]